MSTATGSARTDGRANPAGNRPDGAPTTTRRGTDSASPPERTASGKEAAGAKGAVAKTAGGRTDGAPAGAAKAGDGRAGTGLAALSRPGSALAGRPALRRLLPLLAAALVLVPVAAALWGSGGWPQQLAVDVKTPLDDAYDWVIDNRETSPVFLYFLLHLSNWAEISVDAVTGFLLQLGWTGVITAAVLLAWRIGGAGLRGLRTAGVALAAFAVCGLLGMWEATMETLALMAVAVAVSVVTGLVLGLAAGLSDRFDRLLRPVLDTMQIMPAFAYLLPLVLLFQIGVPAALIATVIYAVPPMARLTSLGLRGADRGVLEAVRSLGAGPVQRLVTARLPLARKEILLGLNQTIMMALSMVTIASVVGAGGLGEEVFSALSTVDVGNALAAGIPIVLLAVWLDRTTAVAGQRVAEGADHEATGVRGLLHGWRAWALVAAAFAAIVPLARKYLIEEWPELWVVEIARPVNEAVQWFTAHLATGVPVVGGTRVWADGFTTGVLSPLRDGLQAVPWWSLVLIAAVLGLLAGGWKAMCTAAAAIALIGVIGVWDKALDTLSQAVAGVALTLVLGFAIGIVAARVGWVERALRPVLDVLQTLPQFIYLIPVVALFNVGRSAAVAAAVLYALPAVVRITVQGLRQVDAGTLEASRSLGASTLQQIRQVQLPLARPALMLALNQGVVLVLAMVIVGGFVGSGALGYDVVFGLQKSELGTGLAAGVAIVLLGVALDRATQRRAPAA
jgi:glycine betaine/proline transport system permease protein